MIVTYPTKTLVYYKDEIEEFRAANRATSSMSIQFKIPKHTFSFNQIVDRIEDKVLFEDKPIELTIPQSELNNKVPNGVPYASYYDENDQLVIRNYQEWLDYISWSGNIIGSTDKTVLLRGRIGPIHRDFKSNEWYPLYKQFNLFLNAK